MLLVAGSLGIDNFAVSIAIGLSGADRSLRVRIAVAFGVFEAGMPVLGLLLGRQLSGTLGAQAALIGGSALALAGVYTIIQAIRSADEPPSGLADAGFGRLLWLAAALSIDNLFVGFALGTSRSPLGLGIAIIAGVSVGLSLIGLELGARLGSGVERTGPLLGGIVLVCVGAAIAAGLL